MQIFFLTLVEAITMAAIPVITGFVVEFLRMKAVQIKEQIKDERAQRYIEKAIDATAHAILCTAQTFTDEMKESGQWTIETQKQALAKALSLAKTLLTKEAVRFLNAAFGDLDEYLRTLIESRIKEMKGNFI